MEWDDYCCEICGSENHTDSDHQMIATADWGRGYALHLKHNMVDFAFAECKALGIDVNKIIADRDQYYRKNKEILAKDNLNRDINAEVEFLDDIEAKLAENGYIPISDSDSGDWTIYKEV